MLTKEAKNIVAPLLRALERGYNAKGGLVGNLGHGLKASELVSFVKDPSRSLRKGHTNVLKMYPGLKKHRVAAHAVNAAFMPVRLFARPALSYGLLGYTGKKLLDAHKEDLPIYDDGSDVSTAVAASAATQLMLPPYGVM